MSAPLTKHMLNATYRAEDIARTVRGLIADTMPSDLPNTPEFMHWMRTQGATVIHDLGQLVEMLEYWHASCHEEWGVNDD